jgi:DNA-binding response OmpR family regulator
VLVVEDDGPIRALVAEICRQQGHDALEAANGAARSARRPRAADLVLVG